jgi:aspartyl-tRNA(Asn)/glutamyl-tRNA(Gln) amidotransferase subunit A
LLEGLDADIVASFNASLEKMRAKGVEIMDVDIALSDIVIAAYYVVNFAEVSTNLARFDGIRYGDAKRGASLLDDYVDSRTLGFGAESKRRILLGTYVLSAGYIDAYYRKAERARAQLRQEYAKAFETVDVIATPTMPTPAFVIGEKSDPLALYLEDVFTVTANLTGMPAISVPMEGVVRDGVALPIGIHFTAPHGSDALLFKIGREVSGETV